MNKLLDFFRTDKFATGIGIELLTAENGHATAILRTTPDHHNAAGVVQGGAIFTLADYAFAAASNSRGRLATGIHVSISYMKAVKSGVLTAHAVEVRCGRTTGTYLVHVTNEAGDEIALFQGTAYRLDQEIPFDE